MGGRGGRRARLAEARAASEVGEEPNQTTKQASAREILDEKTENLPLSTRRQPQAQKPLVTHTREVSERNPLERVKML